MVLSGTCWLVPLEERAASGAGRSHRGGCGLPARRPGAILADDPATPAVEEQPEQFSAGPVLGTLTIGGDGPQTSLLCGNYHLDQGRPHPLVGQLPEIIHLPTGNGRHAS
nr:cupin domain-containing protein [Streptomyces alboflavus]